MVENIFSKERLQERFTTNFDELAEMDHRDVKYIVQSHYGDLLVETSKSEAGKFNLWANYDGVKITGVEVEYCGPLNNWKCETVFEL